MPRPSYDPVALAQSGKRWFAKPPEGYSIPCQGALESFSIYATLMNSSPLGKKIMDALIRKPEIDLSVQIGYAFLAQKWMKENGPTLFVSEEILDACENTDAFGSIEGLDVKTVYPVGYISLPKNRGFVSKQTGDRLAHIWFTIIESGNHEVLANGKSECTRTDGRKLFLNGYWDINNECSSFSLPLDVAGKKLIDVLDETKNKLAYDLNSTLRTSTELLLIESKELGMWMGSLAVNLLLIMQSYPEYMDKISKEKSNRQNFRDKEPPTSIIIRPSKSKTILSIVDSQSDEDESESTGKTIGNHWRRGHWRRQPHGEFWELQNPEVQVIVLSDNRHVHMKWILPIYIGLTEKIES